MGIIKERSVGGIFYQLIDDLYPTQSGITGTVAISTNGDVFTCDSGYTWSVYNQKNLESEIYSYNNNDTTLAPTLNSWLIPGIGAITPFTASTNTSGFTTTGLTTTPAIILSYNNVGRFLTVTNNTLRSDSGQWDQVDWAPSKNNTTPLRYNSTHFGTSVQNDAANIYTPVIHSLDSRLNDRMFMGYRVRSRESGTAYFDRVHTKLSVSLIEKPIIFNENGNTQSFTTNGWTTVNDTTNKWFMGTGTTFSGGGTSIYISNNNGVSNAYTNTVAQASHFYKDFTFPYNLQSDVTLNFFWKSNGESGFDYGKVYLAPTGLTPVSGVEVSSIYRIGATEYNGTTTFANASITIPRESVIGQTKRLIFSWVNDNSVGTDPPMAIDSLRLHFYVDDNAYQPVSGDTETFNYSGFSGNGWSVVNGATNFWVVGTSEFSGTNDNYAAYITNANNTNYYGVDFNGGDNKALARYSTGTAQVSHFYKDFTLTSASTLTFNWKCWGENGLTTSPTNYDYGTVVITTTATTPVAGTEVSTAQATAGGNGRIGATTNSGKFNEGYGGSDNNWRTETINLGAYSGQTKRIVFTWKNDGSVGDNPPFVVDNIKITGAGNWATRLQKLN